MTSENMSPGLLRVMERARRNPHERQFSLAYLIDVESLKRAYRRIRKKAVVGSLQRFNIYQVGVRELPLGRFASRSVHYP